jgi:toxin secretion/phage lysis holin
MLKIFLTGLYKSIRTIASHDTSSITIGVAMATLGTFITYILGGFDYPLLMLIGFIALDYITGILSSAKNKKLNSDIMYWGIIRKISQIVIVGLAVSLDRLMQTDLLIIRLMVIYFYIGMEGISILENLVFLGVKVPKKLVTLLEKIQDDETGKTNEDIRDETCNELVAFGVKKHKKELGKREV